MHGSGRQKGTDMIDLTTGSITLPESSVVLTPLMEREEFLRTFRGMVRPFCDIREGYLWYTIREKVYPDDSPVIIALCFNPQHRLQLVDFHPVESSFSRCADGFWSADQQEKEERSCLDWLESRTGIRRSADYPWGLIRGGYEPSSADCCVSLFYSE